MDIKSTEAGNIISFRVENLGIALFSGASLRILIEVILQLLIFLLLYIAQGAI